MCSCVPACADLDVSTRMCACVSVRGANETAADKNAESCIHEHTSACNEKRATSRDKSPEDLSVYVK